MSLTILEILDLATPFGIGLLAGNFTIFYVEAERLITLSQNRDSTVLNLYDKIIDDIDSSSFSDSKRIKTQTKESYEYGKLSATYQNNVYYIEIISFVRKLQLLVLDRYDSIDTFFEIKGITVSQVFADISEAAGYPISSQYIEDIS